MYATTWLDLFALNPTIKMPDRIMSKGQLVNVGHLYSGGTKLNPNLQTLNPKPKPKGLEFRV